ncbi:MAG: hypothetical protein H6R06_1390 [Proteobacteria bacterium]|jgi:hypothetical protein|nr:hypothetical protein [Pseudomonadota bacterium]
MGLMFRCRLTSRSDVKAPQGAGRSQNIWADSLAV